MDSKDDFPKRAASKCFSITDSASMRAIISLTFVVAHLALACGAEAASATGIIESIDSSAGSIALNNGRTYSVPSSIALAQFKVGDRVIVSYEKAMGKMEVSALTPLM